MLLSNLDGIEVKHICEGLIYIPNFIEEAEELLVTSVINESNWYEKCGRMMQSYGYNYRKGDYNIDLHKTTEIPIELNFLLEKINNLTQKSFNQMTVNKYEAGQGIDAHYDHVTRFGDTISGLTLGSGCTLTFEYMKNRVDMYLEPRSLYIMYGDMRYIWKHKISKLLYDKVDGKNIKRGTRLSLTFRICNL